MPRSVVVEGRSRELALADGLSQLNVEASQVDVEVLKEPKGRLAHMVGGKTVIRVTVKEDSPSASDSTSANPQEPEIAHGQVWVEDGKLNYSEPGEEGRAPTVLIDSKLTAFYQGSKVKGRLELDFGIADLILDIPESIKPKCNANIRISENMLQAFFDYKREPGISNRLMDQKRASTIQLQLMSRNIDPPKITMDQVKALVAESGVRHGVDLSKITDDLLNQRNVYVQIAQGTEPTPPSPSRIDYEFEKRKEPEIDPDALRIDHFELRGVVSVVEGELVATKVLGKNGEKGINVFGESIPASQFKDIDLRTGEGVRVSDDGMHAYATTDGLPVVQNGVLKVLKVFELTTDADISTGHIRFRGEVIVRGSVKEKIQIEAITGGIHVFGLVAGAEMRADGDIIIEKNAVTAQIFAGGMTVVYVKLLSFIHNIMDQGSQLMNGYDLVSNQAKTDDSKLFKHLLELKFHGIPREVRDLIEYCSTLGQQIDPDFHRVVSLLGTTFLGRGPLEIKSIDHVKQLLERLQQWETIFEEQSTKTASIQVKYLQNCRLEASGAVSVTGQGSYYSDVVAGMGFFMERGFFRGGEILVDEGDVQVKELGGPTGVVTQVKLVHEGKITAAKVYPNVTFIIKNQKFKFDSECSSVKAFWAEGGLRVYSGTLELT